MTDTDAPPSQQRRHGGPASAASCSRSRAWSSTSRSRKGLLQRQVGAVQAVDGIDFDVREGETLGAGRRVRLRQVAPPAG